MVCLSQVGCRLLTGQSTRSSAPLPTPTLLTPQAHNSTSCPTLPAPFVMLCRATLSRRRQPSLLSSMWLSPSPGLAGIQTHCESRVHLGGLIVPLFPTLRQPTPRLLRIAVGTFAVLIEQASRGVMTSSSCFATLMRPSGSQLGYSHEVASTTTWLFS